MPPESARKSYSVLPQAPKVENNSSVVSSSA